MTLYRNEAAFSNAFCKHLRRHNWFVQRIESGLTGRGIPDIYAISPTGEAFWFELKRVHSKVRGKDRSPIPWRPGQQAWLNTVHKYGQNVATLAAFDDCILYITHTKIWANDVVLFSQCKICTQINDL